MPGNLAAGGDERPAAAHADAAATLHDLDTIKQRILHPLLEPVDIAAARKLIDTMDADGSWPDVDYQSRRRSAWTTTRHLSNLLFLARAYRAPGSKLRGDGELRQTLGAGLDYWLEHDFQNPNWWWNQIGVPRTLAPILLLVEDELSDAQRQKGLEILRRARIGMTGQNLVWVTEITALRGILDQDPKLVAAAYGRIAEEIRVGTGEGIQPDFSFHQHGPCLYNHGYGAAFAGDCPRIATQVAGTGLAFPEDKITLLSRLLLDGSQWMIRGTASDFGAEGREITRHGQDAAYLATAARYMLQLPTGREDELQALAARASGQTAPPLVGNRHFCRSDMMTHHRPGYYTSARMVSDRIANTDGPANSEGLKSHHLADGCNIVMRTGREYRDVFPVWDWQKIPGTTVEQKPELAGSPRRKGTRGFVGGVSDGTYGLAAFDLVLDSLAARKSWFFFDDEYVCLGAGITCGSDRPVVTTVNQCHLEGDVWIAEASPARKLDKGVHPLEHPAWVWHDSVAYVFLEPSAVHLRNDVERGSWHEINQRYSKDEIAREMFTLWIDHGSGPQTASYAYAVVPGIDRPAVEAFAARPPLKILSNEVTLQAVWHEKLTLTAAAFYEPGPLKIRSDLTVAVDTPCLILIRELPGKLLISVSNPENKQATVRIQMDGRWAGEGVEVIDDQPRSRLTIELPGGPEAGSTVTRTLLRSQSVGCVKRTTVINTNVS